MYIYDRQFSGFRTQIAARPITWRRRSRYYALGEPATYKPGFFPINNPVFGTVPVVLETLRGPQSSGGPQTLIADKAFTDIVTLEKMLRRIPVGRPPETVEFSLGQALMGTQVFKPDPTDPRNFQIPIVHSIGFPADSSDPDKLASSDNPFPVVALTHGQSLNYFFNARIDASGAIIKRSVSGSSFRRIEFDTLQRKIRSYLGFQYLQLELAKHGIVSISINSNPANFFDDRALLKFRADLIRAHLEFLESQNRKPSSPFYQKLDFKRVGLMGHSRGGDAVVKAAVDNRFRFGIKAVVSVAPLDQTGLLEPDKRLRLTDPFLHYLVIYGSHDGDVVDWKCGAADLGTGFTHYDRATCQKSMLFIHGASHNRFNTEWTEDERRVKSEIASGKAGVNRILTRDEHQELAAAYVCGWFRMALNREDSLADLFNGSRVVNVARGPLTVSTQWSFGKRIRVIEDFEGRQASENRLKGKSTATPRLIKTPIGRISSSFPHQTNVLMVGKINAASATFTTEIPNTPSYPGGPRNRDFSIFDLLTFRMTKAFDISPTQLTSAQPLPQFKVRLKDVSGGSSTVTHAEIYAANPHGPTRPYHRVDWGEPCIAGGPRRPAVVMTLNPLETLSVPLTLFDKSNPRLDRHNIRFIEFEFTSVKQDQIFVDDIQLITR